MDADFILAVGEFAQRQRVVEVLGGNRVDGHGSQLAIVGALRQFFFNYFAMAGFKRLCLRFYFGRKRSFEAVLHHNRVHLGAVLAGFADSFKNFALCYFAVVAYKFDKYFGSVGWSSADLYRIG